MTKARERCNYLAFRATDTTLEMLEPPHSATPAPLSPVDTPSTDQRRGLNLNQ